MVKRVRLYPEKTETSSEVGYGKPPKGTQFKLGQSGNPAGRPRGSRNFKTELEATLRAPVKVNKNGTVRKISTRQASLMVLRDKALAGEQRAIEHLHSLALRFDEAAPGTALHRVDANDQDILDHYFKERTSEEKTARRDHDRSNDPTDPTDGELDR